MPEPDGQRTPAEGGRWTRAVRTVRKRHAALTAAGGVLVSVVAAYLVWEFAVANSPDWIALSWGRVLAGATAAAIGLAGGIASLVWTAQRSFTHEAARTLDQIHSDSRRVEVELRGDHNTVHIYGEKEQTASDRTAGQLYEPDAQESMLAEIYSHGLAQAKLSFFVSLTFAILGSVVLLSGVALAVAHADSNGDRYASIVAQTSGVVINGLAAVFFLQSNRTRRDMGAQGVMLREDSRSDRRLRAAALLVDHIQEGGLRDRVRAQMALQLVGSAAQVIPFGDPSGGLSGNPFGDPAGGLSGNPYGDPAGGAAGGAWADGAEAGGQSGSAAPF